MNSGAASASRLMQIASNHFQAWQTCVQDQANETHQGGVMSV
ncbi:hypothetical protein F441_04298 [Phytophthora nicotianae CJ01A1]|uniref:Uncharacterized protein n=6 Tax=Phytophthora nicotianae TaxID=4792 RepID=W2Q9W4_PHYN3|nr:hypothetical protein PPTG_22767 [Phytophthora nicotianae INRA-310]ETI48232.1 hypothetical protein F443_07723 [Phytophthora nicotianae P1569]ETK92520.1 hypothetical protein L915_04207 [Phytophthora nicotianae]ETO76904.1 hypothetical protein F444_07790 [Phytophthora nicotianae P1976]ETP22502.1 hypothetical protein F441_04298 [Phytophthora nicotianae CJ01A1]ETP50384.1 hypothetical protein F442_04319 [Phytophthora nicotianae P10297]